MAYCRYCGKPISDEAVICPSCGAQQGFGGVNKTDNGGFLWGVLGFFGPLVGLILYLLWKDERPRTAKAVGTGALVSAVLSVTLSVLCTSLYMGLGVLMASML